TGTGSEFNNLSSNGTTANNRSIHRPKFNEIQPHEEHIDLHDLDYPIQSYEMASKRSQNGHHERTFSNGSNSVTIPMDMPVSPTSPTSPTEKFHPLSPPPKI
ncbi:hypothetical protein BGZ76_008405, partial [Entomortierella beljakovae]